MKDIDEDKLGGPISGLTRAQLAKFKECKQEFNRIFAVKDGLGPLYNKESCSNCHSLEQNELDVTDKNNLSALDKYQNFDLLIAKISQSSKFAKLSPKDYLDKLKIEDIEYSSKAEGPLVLKKSITEKFQKELLLDPNCQMIPQALNLNSTDLVSKRQTSPCYGLGLIDAMPDREIEFFAAQQLQTKNLRKEGAVGKPVRLPRSIDEWPIVGRFGNKSQSSSLFDYCAYSLAYQIGISNPLYPHPLTFKHLDIFNNCLKSKLPSDPNDNGKILTKLTYYLSLLAPPPRGEINDEVKKGELIFSKAACINCHIAEAKTQDTVLLLEPEAEPLEIKEITQQKEQDFNLTPKFQISKEPKLMRVRALENKVFHPYSDFLVHNLGKDLSDGIAQVGTESGEWRTSPLWGLRFRKKYLHDGRAKTLEEAINMHKGVAEFSQKKYASLSSKEKSELITFLNSL